VDVLYADTAAGSDALDLADRNEANLFLNMTQILEDAKFVAARLDADQDFRRGAHCDLLSKAIQRNRNGVRGLRVNLAETWMRV
jgi:hypothetical protein